MSRKQKSRVHDFGNKQGHVYIASNLGSFGPDVFKIGVTRRLNPADRVKELNNCSVPFPFDIHALIYSDDVFALEKRIHDALKYRSLNHINMRKEFFKISIHEIMEALESMGIETDFVGGYEASEYRRSLAISGVRHLMHESS